MSLLDRVPSDVRGMARERAALLPFFGFVVNMRRNLAVFAEWWPVVLPLLAWVGWRTYRGERRKVLRERETEGPRRAG